MDRPTIREAVAVFDNAESLEISKDGSMSTFDRSSVRDPRESSVPSKVLIVSAE